KRRPEFPFLDEEREDLVLIHRLKKGNLFFAMNPTEHPLTVFYRFGEFFEEKAWITAGWREQEDGICWESIPDRKEYFTAVLPPHGSTLLFLTQEPLREEPGNLWDLDA
ncbi:MAG: hypothetical protein IIY55_11820, partial [Blautia sp.]|nr:hypothetical protein [Blautia sp.]